MNAIYKKITPALIAILIVFVLKTDLQAQRLDISGTGWYVRDGDFVTLGIDRIDHNYNPYGIYLSGQLYLQLWTCYTPYNGLQTSLGYKVAEAIIDPLVVGYSYFNVSKTVPFYAPPNGTYYMVMVLAEYDGYNKTTVDWFNFPSTATFGYIPPPPVVTAPSIVSHPSGLNVTAGASATFSVSANGTSPSYQWYKDGSPISGATGASYTIPSATASDAGNYTVTVFNTAGSVTSNAATLTVGPPPPSITSDLSTVSVPKKKLIPRFTITTNFGAKSFAVKGLPKGLKLNTKNGVISGKPTKPGTYTVTLTARKMKGKKVEQQATATKVVIVY